MEKFRKRSGELAGELEEYGRWVSGLKNALTGVNLISDVAESDYNGKSAYVDGGEGFYELLGSGFYFIRSTALVDDGGEHFFIRDLDLDLIEYGDNTDERVSLKREIMEFDTALKTVEDGCSLLVLDGSVHVKLTQPKVDCPEYPEYVEKARRLVDECAKKNVSIIGVSEDSRSRILTNQVGAQIDLRIPSSLTDSSLLKIVGGEKVFKSRTFNAVCDESVLGKRISTPTLYLQPTPVSHPLRIDFMDGEENIEALTGFIYKLSRQSRNYGYPLPLYIAHLDCALKPEHVEWCARLMIKNALKFRPELSRAILGDTRRNMRPK